MDSSQIDNNAEADFLSLYGQAENGDPEAQYQLGLCFLNEMGTVGNTQLAEVWLLKAASAHHAQALRDLRWIHEASLLDIDLLKQRLAEQAGQPVSQPESQTVAPVPIPAPVPEPEPEPIPLPPLPDYLLVPEYVPLPRKVYEHQPIQPGAVARGTQYLIEGHPAPQEGQSTSYITSTTYTEPVPPYVPQEEETVGGVPSGTEYMLSLPYGFAPVEDTVINHEHPGFLDRIILGFKNQKFHKYSTWAGGFCAFLIVIGIAHAIGKFDNLVGAHSSLRDVTNVIHIHDDSKSQVGVSKSSVNSMVQDIMDASYGRFDAKLGCWASRSGGTEYCIKVNRVDAVKTAEGSRVYVLATGRMANESNLADGVIGMFIIEPQTVNYTVVAKNPFVTAGTGDEPPENWRFVKLGKEDIWGWQGEIENNNLGETDSGVVLFTEIDGNIKNIGYIPTALELLDLDHFNGHIADARRAVDLKGDITIEERAGGHTFYPIRLTISGIRNGTNIKDESIQITFKEESGEYIIPTRNPFTH